MLDWTKPVALVAAVALMALASGGIASAQRRAPRRRAPEVPAAAPLTPAERAQRLLSEADFEGALAAANEAEASDGLDRDTVRTLLETRVLIDAGLGREDALARDLLRLAAIAPGAPAPASFPPPLAARLAQAAGSAVTPGIDASVTTREDGATLTATATQDLGGLVRGMRLWARVDDQAWQSSEDGRIELSVLPGQTLFYYATAFGPGGVVVATAGTEAEPLQRTRAPAVTLPPPEPEPAADETPLWIGLGVGGGVVVLGVVIVIAAVAGSSNDNTLVTLPTGR